MTDQLLMQLCNDQVQFIGEIVEPRRSDDSSERFLEDLDRIIAALSRLSSGLSRVFDMVLKEARLGKVKNLEATGQDGEKLILASIQLCGVIRTRILRANSQGFSVGSLSELERIAAGLERAKVDWTRRWPFVSQSMLEQTAIEFSEGHYQSAKDALHELRNLHH